LVKGELIWTPLSPLSFPLFFRTSYDPVIYSFLPSFLPSFIHLLLNLLLTATMMKGLKGVVSSLVIIVTMLKATPCIDWRKDGKRKSFLDSFGWVLLQN
jgi:hypothetical protein